MNIKAPKCDPRELARNDDDQLSSGDRDAGGVLWDPRNPEHQIILVVCWGPGMAIWRTATRNLTGCICSVTLPVDFAGRHSSSHHRTLTLEGNLTRASRVNSGSKHLRNAHIGASTPEQSVPTRSTRRRRILIFTLARERLGRRQTSARHAIHDYASDTFCSTRASPALDVHRPRQPWRNNAIVVLHCRTLRHRTAPDIQRRIYFT